MSEQKKKGKGATSKQPIPSGQKLFDNYFLWLILSFLISGVLYNTWGLFEIFTRPNFTP